MRNFFSCLFFLILSFGLITEASAARFGSGRSFGVQRSHSSLFSSPTQNTAKSAFGQAGGASKWGGMLGGLLIGGLLASLFMGHGLGTGLLTWLLVGIVVFALISFMRRRMQPGFQSSQMHNFSQNPFNNASNSSNASNASNTSDTNNNYQQQTGSTTSYPAGFYPQDFLREAKVKFIRLQAAFDQKNMADLSAFTSPEMLAEINMQFLERGDKPNKTEVINIEAELLNVDKEVNSIIASVRFTGSIKENDDPITQINEIWHFRQANQQGEWIVVGVQQNDWKPLE